MDNKLKQILAETKEKIVEGMTVEQLFEYRAKFLNK